MKGRESETESAAATAAAAAAAGPAAEHRPTRQRLVETARDLFLASGYSKTGISQILRESRVNAGSLYYFFKTKEDLLLGVLDWYLEALRPFVIEPAFASTTDPIERVFVVLDGYRQMLVMTDCRQGCPIGNLALEMTERSEAVREKIALNFANWVACIHECLDAAIDRLPDGTDRGKLASFFLTVMEGGVMQARTQRRLEPFDHAVELLRDYVDRLLAEKAAP